MQGITMQKKTTGLHHAELTALQLTVYSSSR